MSRMSVLFLMTIFHWYLGKRLSFENDSVCENLLLSACLCWDSSHSTLEMDEIFKLGGNLGNGDSYWEVLFRHFKVFRLHSILHDAAGAVRAQRGKSPSYCCKIGRGPHSFSIGHVPGLVFCPYVKIVLLSLLNFFDV